MAVAACVADPIVMEALSEFGHRLEMSQGKEGARVTWECGGPCSRKGLMRGNVEMGVARR